MGIISSRIRQKSKAERLAILETGIKKKESDRLNNTQKRATVKCCLIIFSVILYVLLIILNLCFLVPYLVIIIYPFIGTSVIFIILRCYTRSLSNSQYKLYMMREEKKLLLEEVKVTETYMVAKEILERYGSSENLLQDPDTAYNVSGKSRRNVEEV